MRSASGVEIALAVLLAPKDARMSLRAFVASGDLCADLLFNAVDVQPGAKSSAVQPTPAAGYHARSSTICLERRFGCHSLRS